MAMQVYQTLYADNSNYSFFLSAHEHSKIDYVLGNQYYKTSQIFTT